jgi:hypothetical protein
MNEEDKITPWQKYKQSLGEARPWDLLNPNEEIVDADTRIQRLSICETCPELLQLTKQCKKCGCIMPLKAKLRKAECPIGKW